MRNTVTRLKPRTADFGVAHAAFNVGHYLRCVEGLAENLSLPARCLRARSLIRLGRHFDALSSIEDINFQDVPHQYAGELLALKANALVLLGDSSAGMALTEARARAFSSGFAAIECEVEFVSALEAWTHGRVDEALDALQRLIDIDEDAPTFSLDRRGDYVYSAGYWRARAHDMRGLSRGLAGDFLGQASAIATAFVEFDRAGIGDRVFEVRMLSNMAVLVRDLQSEALAAYVEDRADAIVWNEHTAAAEFEVFQAIGWNRAKRGDHLGAFRHLRRSASCAPSVPLRICAILDRSFLARELGETLTAAEDLDHAVRLAKQVDWENSDGAERGALYALARQLAPIDTTQARALWNRYATLKSSVSSLHLAARGDRRQRADECSAHAAVLVAEGEHSRAISLLLESLEIWNEIGYSWRAAAVALSLAELTGEARYFELVAHEAEKQPNSWIARRFASVSIPAQR